jgi:hypothetical protein
MAASLFRNDKPLCVQCFVTDADIKLDGDISAM